MEINDFAAKVCAAVKKELGRKYKAEVKKVRKNNGILLHGLLISSKEQNVVPTIYLENSVDDCSLSELPEYENCEAIELGTGGGTAWAGSMDTAGFPQGSRI